MQLLSNPTLTVTKFPLSNEYLVYKVHDPRTKKTYVLRDMSARGEEKRHTEISITQWAGNIAVGPRVIRTDYSYILLQYLNQGTLFDNKKDYIPKLATLFNKLHCSTPPDNLLRLDSQVEKFNKDIKLVDIELPQFILDIQDRANRVDRQIKSSRLYKKVLCHNDPHSKNIMWHDNELKFIDWEFAHPDDRFIDIATAAQILFLTQEEEEQLLLHYSGEITDEVRQHYQLVRQLPCLEHIGWKMRVGSKRAGFKQMLEEEYRSDDIPDFSTRLKYCIANGYDQEDDRDFIRSIIATVREFNKRQIN